jgi:hypothetical protein
MVYASTPHTLSMMEKKTDVAVTGVDQGCSLQGQDTCMHHPPESPELQLSMTHALSNPLCQALQAYALGQIHDVSQSHIITTSPVESPFRHVTLSCQDMNATCIDPLLLRPTKEMLIREDQPGASDSVQSSQAQA